MNATVRSAIALALALGVLALFVLAVGWEDVFAATARASLSVYALAFLASAFVLIARSYVWHRLLGAVDRPRPYWLIGGVYLTATFAKYVTPYGQVASGVGTAAVVSRYYESAYEESLAGVVSADFLTYLPYYSFGLVGLALLVASGPVPAALLEFGAPAVALVVVAAVGLATVWTRRSLVIRGLLRVGTALQGVVARISPTRAAALEREALRERLRGFYVTLDLLSGDRRTVAVAVLVAHLGWLGLAAALHFSALSVGVELPAAVVLLTVALSKLGFLVPTPGGVGGVEIALAGVLFALTPVGGAAATAIAILYRFGTYWFTVLVGGVTSVALAATDPTPP